MNQQPPPGVGANDAAQMAPPVAPAPRPFDQQPNSILTLTPAYMFLIGQARDQLRAGQFQFAVILAQASCELATEQTLNNLMRRRADFLREAVLSDLRSGVALDDRKARRLYTALTGDYPAGHRETKLLPAPWWEAWSESRQLRHGVAHAGHQVSEDQAQRCIDASQQYLDHLVRICS